MDGPVRFGLVDLYISLSLNRHTIASRVYGLESDQGLVGEAVVWSNFRTTKPWVTESPSFEDKAKEAAVFGKNGHGFLLLRG